MAARAVPSNIDLLRLTMGNLTRDPVQAMRVQARIVRQLADAAGITSLSSPPSRPAQRQGLAQPARAMGRGSRCRPRRRRRRRGTRRSPATAASPCALRRWTTSSASRRPPAARSTTSSWRFVRVGCASTCCPTTRCPTARCGRWCRCRSAPAEETDPWTNRVSAIVADLPTDCDDPVERVARCREAMRDAKRLLELVPASELVDMAQFSPPVLATAAVRVGVPAAPRRPGRPAVQPGDLQRPRTPAAAVFRRGQDGSPVPGLDRHRRPGPQHHRHQLLDRLDFGFIVDREPCPTCGTWPTCTSTRSAGCSTPPAPNGPSHRSRRSRAAVRSRRSSSDESNETEGSGPRRRRRRRRRSRPNRVATKSTAKTSENENDHARQRAAQGSWESRCSDGTGAA